MIECDDVLVPVGQGSRITARLVRRGIFRLGFNLSGRIISFWVEGDKISKVRTGPDGTATATYTPVREKEYSIAVVYEGWRKSEGSTAEATIFSRNTRREGIILDLDGTLSDSSTLSSVFKKSERIRPLKGAVDVTRALAARYDLLVLTGRKSIFRRKTKRWLEEQGFPRAPVYFSSFTGVSQNHEKFKRELIGSLKRTWRNITTGIGDRDSDARAYLASGLKSLIIREKGECPRGAIIARDWGAIRNLLLE